MALAIELPPRGKMFTHSGNLSIPCRTALTHLRTKHPTMMPESPPLTEEERAWLVSFIDEWALRMERGLLSRKLRRAKKGTKPWNGQT